MVALEPPPLRVTDEETEACSGKTGGPGFQAGEDVRTESRAGLGRPVDPKHCGGCCRALQGLAQGFPYAVPVMRRSHRWNEDSGR